MRSSFGLLTQPYKPVADDERAGFTLLVAEKATYTVKCIYTPNLEPVVLIKWKPAY